MRDYIVGFAASTASARTSVQHRGRRRRGRSRRLGGHDLRRRARRYDGVIVANGHLWDPFVPEYPGRFDGRVLHSGALPQRGRPRGRPRARRRRGQLGLRPRGRRRAGGPRHLRLGAQRARCSSPRRCSAGRARSCRCSARLPVRLQERVTRELIDVALGAPERYGPAGAGDAQPAPQPARRQRPAAALHPPRPRPRRARHRALRRPRRCTSPTAAARAFDTIVYATGFKVTLPFLDPALLQWRDGVPLRVAGMTLPVGARAAVLRRPRRPARAAAAGLLGPGAADRQVPHRGPPARRRASRRAEARIDIPRHEWQRDMDRAHRRADRVLRRAPRAPAPIAPRRDSRPRMSGRLEGRSR